MSRKDYIKIAAAFAQTRPYVAARSTKQQRACYAVWHALRGHIMAVLQADNPNFDRYRFIDATEE